LEYVAQVGIKNVGIDLMYNLPEQTLTEWLEDVQKAIDLDIKHITLFSLCVVPFTRFAKQLKEGEVPPVGSEDYEIDLFIAARDHLLKAGYVQYSVWDFAKPEFIDKHVIWYYKKQKDLISHGPGAFGYINRYMYINQGKLSNYFTSLEAGHFPVEVGEKADREEAMNGMMAKSLRMMDVHRGDFKELFGVDPADHYKDKIQQLVEQDLLEVTPETIRLTPKGQVWGNNVCKEFFSEKNKQSFEMRVQLAKGKKPGADK
jgi:oxygen-independent coproporphyrinogen-3 oxidase